MKAHVLAARRARNAIGKRMRAAGLDPNNKADRDKDFWDTMAEIRRDLQERRK